MSFEFGRLVLGEGILALVRCGALLVTWFVVTPAWARPSAEELAVARQLFDKAVAAENKNAWQECEEALAEALGIVETPGLRFHQAHCKEQQSKWIEALVDYKRAEELITGGVGAADVEPLLQPAITRLDAKVPRLTVYVTNKPERVTFYLDGKERSANLLGKGLPMNPGEHSFEVSAAGYDSATRTVSLKEGERSELRLSLEANGEEVAVAEPNRAQADKPPAPRERGSKGVSAKPFVLAAEGLVAVAAASLSLKFYLDMRSFREERSRQLAALGGGYCRDERVDEASCQALRRVAAKETDYGNYAIYSAIGGGAALAILITTWLAWDDRPRVIVGYDPTHGVASVGMSGEF